MKFIINFFLTILLSNYFATAGAQAASHVARLPVVITYNDNKILAQIVLGILVNRLSFPEDYIELRHQDQSCQKIPRAIIQLCIVNQDLKLVFWDREKWEQDFFPTIKFAKDDLNNLAQIPLAKQQQQIPNHPDWKNSNVYQD